MWEFVKKSADSKSVTCQLCKKQLTYCGNTTNLKEHLKRKHPAEFHSVSSLPSPHDEAQSEDAFLDVTRRQSETSIQNTPEIKFYSQPGTS